MGMGIPLWRSGPGREARAGPDLEVDVVDRIAPRPLQNPIPVYSGFTHSLQTSLYWAREGGKPIVMANEMSEIGQPCCWCSVTR